MRALVQPEDGVSPLLSGIMGAKKSVEIAIFRFDHRGIETALERAVARGVSVHALITYANRGGEKNPWLDAKIKPLHLTEAEIDALVALMQALEGEGYQDTPPASFPQ